MVNTTKALPKTAVVLALAGALAFDVAAIMPNPARAATELSRKVTNSDATASVSVPDGWNFTRGRGGYISVTGPQGERLNFGAVVLAKDAPAGAASTGTLFALPFTASLKDKLTAAFIGYAAKTGAPDPDVTYLAQLPAQSPQCARFIGGITTKDGPGKFEASICSLRPDSLGIYRNLVFEAHFPASLAAQDRPIVEAIWQTYSIDQAALARANAKDSETAENIMSDAQRGVGQAIKNSENMDEQLRHP